MGCSSPTSATATAPTPTASRSALRSPDGSVSPPRTPAADDGHLAWLDPYFGGTCYRIGYERAIRDGIVAPFIVTLRGVELTPVERAEYDDLTSILSAARAQLIASVDLAPEPAGAFFAAVARLARGDHGTATVAARRYLAALQQRRRLLADTAAKAAALDALIPTLERSERAIVFTQSIAAAEHAASRLRIARPARRRHPLPARSH